MAGPNTLLLLTQFAAPAPSLPGLIDGIEPEAQGHVPPFADGNGHLYRVTEEFAVDGNNPMMMKSIDGGATWAEADAAGAPEGSSVNDLESGWMLQTGTVLIFLWTDDANVYYSTFNTSDAATNPDTWQIKAEVGVSGLLSGSRAQASMSRLSDGRIRTVFQDSLAGTNNQSAYATKSTTTSAGGWSAKARLTVDADNVGGSVCVTGAADKLHIFLHDIANRTVLYQTLTSADVLSSAARVDTAGTNSATPNWHALTNAVYYDAAGAEIVSVLYAATGGPLREIRVSGGTVTDDLVTSSAIGVAPTGLSGATGADGPHAHLAVDGTTLHAVWVDGTSGDLMYASRPHAGSWTAPSTLWSSGAEGAYWCYNNVYSRGGNTVMGYTFDVGPHVDDDSNIYYNELVLTAPVPTGSGAGSWSFTGSGSGKRQPKASGAGSWTVTGTGVGKRTPKASGTGTWSFTATGSGKRVPRATGSGSWSFTGSGTGATVRRGTGSGTATWTGTGSGTAPTVSAYTPHVYVTADLDYTPGIFRLASDGAATAVLSGGAAATSALASNGAGAAALAATGVSAAALAGDGTSTATLTAATGTAVLQTTT